jgi:hypothetical protein
MIDIVLSFLRLARERDIIYQGESGDLSFTYSYGNGSKC